MKRLKYTFLFIVLVIPAFGQASHEPKFPPGALKEDLEYLKQQLYTVHVYPYTEFSKEEYDQLFDHIDARLTDSLTATSFLKMIKPVIAHLCDEHAQVYLPTKLLWKSYQADSVFLPITLSRHGDFFRIEKVLSGQSNLQTGEIITQIDNQSINGLLGQCALFTSGYPDQRLEKTLRQFGYMYTWSLPGIQHRYTITTGTGKKIAVNGVSLQTWENEINKQTGWNARCDEKISYQKLGDAGYINACSFNIAQNQLDSISKQIDMIFRQIQNDKPKYLFIDISSNSGGQSSVGDMLINGFYNKPYRGYSNNFKKSEAYVKLLKSWGIEADDYYKTAPEGKVFHFASDTIFTNAKGYHFNGRVFVIVGNGTFSSAMMMATLVKDNHMAIIAGETPKLGHPNGFGEMYNTKLPNTKINLLFGVKQWIRPSGDLKDNLLRPDIQVKLTDDKPSLIKNVLAGQN